MKPKISSWVWNGAAFAPGDSVPLTDRGFRYGMSVFESIRVWKNTPLFFTGHMERLRRACERCAFQIDEAIFSPAENLLRASGEGFARIYVTAGDGAVAASPENSRVYVFSEPRGEVAPEIYERGYSLGISPEPHRALFGGLKTANYWACAHALAMARAHGRDEALLFSEHGELISACTANVFIVRAGKVSTPALETGARDGVVRAWVSSRCDVKQRKLTRADLAGADEIFLTNSWLGIMPVAMLDDRKLRAVAFANELRLEYEREFLASP